MKILLGSVCAAVLSLGWFGSESAPATSLDALDASDGLAPAQCAPEACPADACPLLECDEGPCPGACDVQVERLDERTCRVTCEAPSGERCTVLVDCEAADCAVQECTPQDCTPRDCTPQNCTPSNGPSQCTPGDCEPGSCSPVAR